MKVYRQDNGKIMIQLHDGADHYGVTNEQAMVLAIELSGIASENEGEGIVVRTDKEKLEAILAFMGYRVTSIGTFGYERVAEFSAMRENDG